MPQNPPPGTPRILARPTYDNVAAAAEFLCRVFGFEEDERDRYLDEHSNVVLTELSVLDSRIMIGISGNHGLASPQQLGGCSQMLVVYVDEVDAHYRRAIDEGARIVLEINDAPWGDRRYEVLDCEGHRWGFHERRSL